jgi:membrane protease YdiL (CAAX protease family)
MNPLLSTFQQLKPWPRLLFFISLTLIGAAVGGALGVLLLQYITGLELNQLPDYMGQYENPVAMKHLSWYNSLSQLFVFLIPSIWFIWLVIGNFKKGLWLYTPQYTIVLIPLIILGISPVINFVEILNHVLIPEGSWLESMALPQEMELKNLTQGILKLETSGGLIWTIVAIILFPAICEEIAFRGVLQPVLGRITKNIQLSIWVTAFIFSFIHFQFYGFLPRMVLGALFGYMVVWTGSLWTSVVAHGLHNGLAFMAFREAGTMEPQELAPSDTGITLYLWLVIGIAALMFMAKRSVFYKRKDEFFGVPNSTKASPSALSRGEGTDPAN